jgi:hypothetical protein
MLTKEQVLLNKNMLKGVPLTEFQNTVAFSTFHAAFVKSFAIGLHGLHGVHCKKEGLSTVSS